MLTRTGRFLHRDGLKNPPRSAGFSVKFILAHHRSAEKIPVPVTVALPSSFI